MTPARHFSMCLLAAALCFTASCGVYSFTGASVTPDINTVTIQNITNQSSRGSITISQGLTDKIKDKFISETNLKLLNSGGDIELKGAVTNYAIQGTAPTADQTTALNRLTITVNIEFINRKNEKESWSKSFSRYGDYEGTVNLADVEESLVNTINTELADDIFNQAFVNW